MGAQLAGRPGDPQTWAYESTGFPAQGVSSYHRGPERLHEAAHVKPRWGHVGPVSYNSASGNSDHGFADATQTHPFLSMEVENNGPI